MFRRFPSGIVWRWAATFLFLRLYSGRNPAKGAYPGPASQPREPVPRRTKLVKRADKDQADVLNFLGPVAITLPC